LSRMTTEPGSSSGIRTFSTSVSNASRSMAPEITHGATIPSQDRPAIRVWLPHRRNGAAPVHTGHFGIGACLLKKDQPMRLRAHDLLAPLPVLSRLSYLGLAAALLQT
jgi:hypothetical protein